MTQSSRANRQAVCLVGLLVSVVWFAAAAHPAMQAPNAADGPWSGQMQCVVSARGSGYQDDQTHTWRIIPGPPVLNGIFRQWPAVWTVQGSGNRTLPDGTPETWTTTVPETRAPLAFAVNAVTGQMRIGSQHGLLSTTGAITGRTGRGQTPLVGGGQEWPFPIVDDVATATTISGTRTRPAPNGAGWRQPPGTPTTETCTWNFSKTPAQAQQQISSAATGTTTTDPARTLRSAGAPTGIQAPALTSAGDITGGKKAAGELVDRNGLRAALAITVSYPNGGETINVGTPITIRWTHLLPITARFTADVSYDGGATWTPTNSGTGTFDGTGRLDWTFSGNGSTRARVRVRTEDGTSSDQSDADFTIVAAAPPASGSSTSSTGTSGAGTGTVQLTSPNGGETWTRPGPTALPDVKWTSSYPTTQYFDVNFSGDGGATWQKVTTVPGTATGISVANLMQNGRWTPPYTEQALFNIAPSGGRGGGDTSDAPFHIRKPIAVTSPNGGETLTIGTLATITFTWAWPQGSGYSPRLQVSYDGGTTWTDAKDASGSIVSGGRFDWPVVGPPATRARLRVGAVYGTTGADTAGALVVSDDSDADFAIVYPPTQ